MAIACVHCASDCGKQPVIWDNKPFCCNGCKQVYQILNEHKLDQYYTFEKSPGIKVDIDSHDQKYAFLDNPEVKEKLFDFYEPPIAKVTFYIPSIHCVSCIWLLENLHRLNRGIKHAAVNFIKKEYTVSFDTREITLRQLVELLVSIHYIPDLSLQTMEKKAKPDINRTLWYKIGVAGFVFGNVMLYSLPEYFNGARLEGSLGIFLYWLCYVLTFPLVFYSGSDYIISAFKNLIKGIINIDLPIALGIITLFLVTTFDVFTGRGPGYSDTLAGFLFFLLLGKWYQSKTYQSLSFERNYKSYFPVAVSRLINGVEESTLLKDIKVGDVLLIRNKELIPADSVLLQGTALIDYSFVTGESTPIKKLIGEPIYAGGVQTSGAITIKVSHEVEQSHLTQLWNQSHDKKHYIKSITSIIDKLSIYFTLIIIAIALSGFLYWYLDGNIQTAILVLTSVLIVACPCALAMSLPFTLGNTMRIFGQNGFYIKNTEVIEKLTQIDTLVFDKTGTLTQPDKNNIYFEGTNLTSHELQLVVSLASQSTHPLSNAIAKQFAGIDRVAVNGFVEVSGRGIYATIEEIPVKLGSKEYVTNDKLMSTLTTSQVFVSINDEVKGYFSIGNAYREGFGKVIKQLANLYKLYLLSGDNASEKNYLMQYFDESQMHFEQSPLQKMDFILQLQANGKKVLMTGDGLNDAGAFMESHVALSVADDIYHFSPAGDAIIEATKFEQLEKFIAFANKSLTVVKISFAISLLYNLIGLTIALSGNLSPVVAAILMPVSSISVVAFATFATRFLGKITLGKA